MAPHRDARSRPREQQRRKGDEIIRILRTTVSAMPSCSKGLSCSKPPKLMAHKRQVTWISKHIGFFTGRRIGVLAPGGFARSLAPRGRRGHSKASVGKRSRGPRGRGRGNAVIILLSLAHLMMRWPRAAAGCRGPATTATASRPFAAFVRPSPPRQSQGRATATARHQPSCKATDENP